MRRRIPPPRRPTQGLALTHPVAAAVARRQVVDADLLKLRLAEELALQEFEAGTARHRAWRDLMAVQLAAEELARAGIGAEMATLLQETRPLLMCMAAGPWPAAADAGAIAALRHLQQLHDQQRSMASKAEFDAARLRVVRRVVAAGGRPIE